MARNLIVDVTGFRYVEHAEELDIEMQVSFNGAIFRGNSYSVSGRLVVGDNGSNPRFSRRYANNNFQKLERNLKLAAGAAATVIVLDEMNKK